MLSRANSRFFKKIILRFRREIKKFGRSISLLSNPDIRWNNREIPLDKATCLTNNSIVIRKRIAAGCNDSNRISCYLKIDESLFALLVIYLYDGQLLLKKAVLLLWCAHLCMEQKYSCSLFAVLMQFTLLTITLYSDKVLANEISNL